MTRANLFRDANQIFPSDSSIAVALGDLDGDGDLDAYVSNRIEAEPMFDRIYLNDGQGHFIDSGQTINIDNAQIALADLDGDGDLDVFAATNQPPGIPVPGDENRVLLNRGNGRFTDSGQELGQSESGRVVLADVDGNGTIDAVVGNLGGDDAIDQPGNQVYLNDGLGNFTDSGQLLGDHSSRGVAVGDLDGNGTPDMFVADENGNRVYTNQAGDGFFADTGQLLGNGLGFDVALADFDQDGDLDAFVAKQGADEVYSNDGMGNFQLEFTLADGPSVGVELGDLDGDGLIDAFVVSPDGLDRFYFNEGAGFSFIGEFVEGSRGTGLALGDLDADGDLDAFIANNGLPIGSANTVLFNQTTEPSGTILIDAGTRVADGLRGGVQGLQGAFYDRDDAPLTIDSLAFADQIIATQNPDAVFDAYELDYPAGSIDTFFISSISGYIGNENRSFEPRQALSASTSPSVWTFDGFIQIDAHHDIIEGNDTIDVEFGLGSDDGSLLTIGGTEILAIDTVGTVNFPGVSAMASFETAGLYPIEIVHYDHFGGIGLEVSSSIPGGNDAGGPGDTVGILPQELLFQTTEIDIGEPLPNLVNRQALDPSEINGADPDQFTIGDSGDARITFLSEDGGFNSALGAYLIADDNTIIDPTIVFESMVTDGRSPTITSGETLKLSDLFSANALAASGRFGLFLVADGASGNLSHLSDGTLAFMDGTQAAKTTSRVPDLVHIADDGAVTSIDGMVMHTVDDGSSNPLSNALNVGKTGQAVSGVRDGHYTVAFEDMAAGSRGSDDDFNDVMIIVDNYSLDQLLMPPADIV